MSTLAPSRPRSREHNGTQARRQAPLGSYTDAAGTRHELVCVAGAEDTRLVVDQVLGRAHGPRLLAHLAADEPAQNAALVVSAYLAAPRACRSLTPSDLQLAFGEGVSSSNGANGSPPAGEPSLSERLVDRSGVVYQLAPVRPGAGIAQLRWTGRQADGGRREVLSVRAVVGALESYEPVLALTHAAVARHEGDAAVSVAVLRAEHERVVESPIVLNRGLREAVEAVIASGEVCASEIAIRCGRLRRGPRGRLAGETSWLSRRIGQGPEAGASKPTPWIHSDVLALIAREGLGVSPREVEV
jgi:hypothetical protein